MKTRITHRIEALTQMLVMGLAFAQAPANSAAQADLGGGARSADPQIAVSRSAVDFGLVGVKRTAEIALTVSNAGGGLLKGKAVATGPFKLESATYSLRAGQSQWVIVRYRPTAPGSDTGSIALSGGAGAQVALTGRGGTPPPPPRYLRFVTDADYRQADFVVRYSDDRTSYVLKPVQQEAFGRGTFYIPLERAKVIELAAAQPRHESVIIVLPKYTTLTPATEERIKATWLMDLSGMGYQHFTFALGDNKVDHIVGLPILDPPQLATASVANR